MKIDTHSELHFEQLIEDIRRWGQELGFQQIGISDTGLEKAEKHLHGWLERGYHGDMEYMARHGHKRSRPQELVPGTRRIITVRMDYLPQQAQVALNNLGVASKAYVSRYALGRDYHKLLRSRLKQLAKKIEAAIGPYHYRLFTDSAPVLEKALAEKAGLGWIGKHSNLINRGAGSWFFLGEIYTDLPLPVDEAVDEHCGSCRACLDICPTRAIVAPYEVDARLCISYLTIEYRGVIKKSLRPLLGNRIYGCDDCQLCCPWNRFAKLTGEKDFHPRHALDDSELLSLFQWSEAEFLRNLEGSPIRRIGYECWQRNITIALGNAPYHEDILATLRARLPDSTEMVAEHISWAIQRQQTAASKSSKPET